MISWLSRINRDYLIFGGIALAVIIFVGVLNRPKQIDPRQAEADAEVREKHHVAYLPTSNTYITSASEHYQSGNVSAPGAPINIRGPQDETTVPDPIVSIPEMPWGWIPGWTPAFPGPVQPAPVTPVPVQPAPVTPVQPKPVVPAPVVTQPTPSGPHAKRPKDPGMTEMDFRGWWMYPGQTLQTSTCIYVQRSGHYLCRGFKAYFLKHGPASEYGRFGNPVSEEYRDPTNNAVRQDFERGTMYWQPGSDSSNFDVRWVSKGGAGGSAVMDLQFGSPGAPPRNAPTYQPLRPYATAASHRVRPGETLSDLGEIYSIEWQKIYAANREAIDAAAHAQGMPIPGGAWNNIVAGMTLKIPTS